MLAIIIHHFINPAAMNRFAFWLFFIMLFLFTSLQSQTFTLKGKVVDSKTKQPIPEVSIYLNNTSIHTMTDANGIFQLVVDERLNTDLIISRVSYHLISIPDPFNEIPDIIYLTEKDNTLNEVVVVGDGLTREEKLKMFREYFLGTSKGGKSCKILNEDDINLFYDMEEKMLTASSESPLIIENDYLGYKIHFNLISFYVQYNGNHKLNRLKESFFAGATLFIDDKPGNKKIEKRRKEAFKKSARFFLKNFVNNTLNKTNYVLYTDEKEQINDLKRYFEIKDVLDMKQVRIIRYDDILQPQSGERPVYMNLTIIGSGKYSRSGIIFYTDSFRVDRYGNVDLVDESGNLDALNKLSFFGDFGGQLIGDTLPLNYEP